MPSLEALTVDYPRVALAVGDRLVRANVPDVSLVLVEEGLVVLRTPMPGAERDAITCHAGAGALILAPDPDERLVALTESRLVLVPDGRRDELLATPEGARLVVEGLSTTLRQKHRTIAGISRFHHVDRVREKLIQLAREHGRVGRDGVRLDFPLTHELLGAMTGSARETVTRALDELQREGFIVRRGRTYSLHVPPEALAR
jgi:hypothetical protein